MKNLSDLNDAAKQPNPQPDFDKVLGEYRQIHQHLQEDIQVSVKKTMWTPVELLSTLLGVVCLTVVIVWWSSSANTEKVLPQKARPSLIWKELNLAVTVSNEKESKEEVLTKPKTPQIQKTENIVNAQSDREKRVKNETIKPAKSKPSFRMNVFTKAKPMMGMQALYAYLQKALRYPKGARVHKVKGKVLVRFEVDPQGKITNLSVVKGLGHGCNEEAIRVVQNMPAWEAATVNGKPIKSALKIPIVFNYQELKSPTVKTKKIKE